MPTISGKERGHPSRASLLGEHYKPPFVEVKWTKKSKFTIVTYFQAGLLAFFFTILIRPVVLLRVVLCKNKHLQN